MGASVAPGQYRDARDYLQRLLSHCRRGGNDVYAAAGQVFSGPAVFNSNSYAVGALFGTQVAAKEQVMHAEIYTDGVDEITVGGSIVRVDLVSLSPTERDANNVP